MKTKILRLFTSSSHTWRQWGAGSVMVAIMLAGVGGSNSAYALGSASFSLSPASGSHTVGATFSVSLYENGSDVGGFNANLSYPSSLLQCEGVSVGSSFNVPGGQSCGGGSVSVGAAATAAKNNSVLAATMTFKVLAKGTAAVHLTTGSGAGVTQILDYNTSANIWNGGLPSASFSLTSTTSSGGGTSSSGSTSTSSSTPSSTTSAPAPTTATSTKKKTTSQTTTKPATQPLGSLSITVSDDEGGRLVNALVVLDGQQKSYTNASGVVNFAGVKGGSHTVTITAKGQKQYTATVSLTPGQNELVTYQLSKSSTSAPRSRTPWVGISIATGVVVLAAAGAAFWYRYFKLGNHALPWGHKRPMMTFPDPDTNQAYYEAVDPSRPAAQSPASNGDKPKFIR